MSDLVFFKGLSTNLDSHSLVNGQILFTEDTNELYIDFLSPEDKELVRKPIQDKQVAELLQQHIENLNKVENKSSEDIRNELTYENIITALGYIPSAGGDSSFAAESITYNNEESNLNGENVQAALDEIVEKNAINQLKIEQIELELVQENIEKSNKVWKTDENGVPGWYEEKTVILYNEIGDNTDGAMTQAAVTALVGDIGSILDEINMMEV